MIGHKKKPPHPHCGRDCTGERCALRKDGCIALPLPREDLKP